jgi:hypothetical protein
MLKKIVTFALAMMLGLVAPIQAGSDIYAGLFNKAVTAASSVSAPAVATTTAAVASTSVASAIGIGFGAAIAMPVIGALVGLGCWWAKNKLKSKNSNDVRREIKPGAAMFFGGFAGAVVSPIVAGLLTTGASSQLVAIRADLGLKCLAGGIPLLLSDWERLREWPLMLCLLLC